MSVLFILEQNSAIKRKNNQISIYDKEGKIIAGYPLSFFKDIFLLGSIEISNSAISFLLKNGKNIIFLTNKGFFKGILIGKDTGNKREQRIKQYRIFFSEKDSILFSKYIISQKIEYIEKIFSISLDKEKRLLEKATDKNQILGIEGVASSKMFNVFRKLLKEIGVNFRKRSYNPPLDEVNSILSSVYTIFHNILIPSVYSEGFDPYLGIFHVKKGNHHAFVSDLMELIRPQLTFAVYEFLKENPIENLDFIENKGVYLSGDSLREVLGWFSERGYIEKNTSKALNEIVSYFAKL